MPVDRAGRVSCGKCSRVLNADDQQVYYETCGNDPQEWGEIECGPCANDAPPEDWGYPPSSAAKD